MLLSPTAELELLLLCARVRVDDDGAKRILGRLDGGLDWNMVVKAALRHGLIPLVYRTLVGLGLRNVPPPIQAQLRTLSESFRFRTLVHFSELIRLQQALTTAGIVAVPYKGPALAACLYGDVTLRQIQDIDVLVRPGDALRARRVLMDNGCVPVRKLSDRFAAAHVRYHCDFDFTTDKRVGVDLGWRNAPGYWFLPNLPELAWTRLGRLTLAGYDVPWLCREDLLLVLCLHGGKHKWDTLKWIVDVAELLRLHPGIQWPEMWESARQAGAERMLALGLFLAHDLLQAPLPPDVLAHVRSRPRVLALAAEVCASSFAADAAPATTLVELAFLARATERLSARLACQVLRPFYFVLHHMLRPGVAVLQRALAGS